MEASESSGDALSRSHDKMPFPKLPFDESLLPKLPLPAKNADFFPGLTLGRSIGESTLQDFVTIPFFPNLRFRHQNMEVPPLPVFGLGHMPPTFSSFPENRRRVLENIMIRAGSGAVNPLKKKIVKDFWSEDELDFLWVGVRRHRRGGWDAMLRDPKLKFARFRTPEELAAKWEDEQVKVFDIPTQKQPTNKNFGKSPAIPSISDGMMKRALHRSRFSAGPTNFQPHLIDINLSFDDSSTSGLKHMENPVQNDHFRSIPTWIPDGFCAKESSAGPAEPFLPNLMGSFDLNGVGMFDLQQKQEAGCVNEHLKTPNFLDNNDNKLPHWLREAVSVPVRPQERELPPTVTAIAHSVRLLYGDEKPTIPPFIAPALLPSLPEDPRRSLKKKKKRVGIHHPLPPDSGHVASTSGSKAAAPPSPSWNEPDLNVPPPNLNPESQTMLLESKAPSMATADSPQDEEVLSDDDDESSSVL